MQVVHSDIAYEETESLSGYRYTVSFIDDFQRFARMYYLRSTDECLDRLKELVAECGIPVKLRTDNGGEYISRDFKEFCVTKKIFHELA